MTRNEFNFVSPLAAPLPMPIIFSFASEKFRRVSVTPFMLLLLLFYDHSSPVRSTSIFIANQSLWDQSHFFFFSLLAFFAFIYFAPSSSSSYSFTPSISKLLFLLPFLSFFPFYFLLLLHAVDLKAIFSEMLLVVSRQLTSEPRCRPDRRVRFFGCWDAAIHQVLGAQKSRSKVLGPVRPHRSVISSP